MIGIEWDFVLLIVLCSAAGQLQSFESTQRRREKRGWQGQGCVRVNGYCKAAPGLLARQLSVLQCKAAGQCTMQSQVYIHASPDLARRMKVFSVV